MLFAQFAYFNQYSGLHTQGMARLSFTGSTWCTLNLTSCYYGLGSNRRVCQTSCVKINGVHALTLTS